VESTSDRGPCRDCRPCRRAESPLKSRSSKNQAFPKFETYREQIDGRHWFPTYTHADDTLRFKNGDNVRIRMTVKYQDYKRYEGKSTIRYGDVVDETVKPPTKKQ
jgi:hypothetical protein